MDVSLKWTRLTSNWPATPFTDSPKGSGLCLNIKGKTGRRVLGSASSQNTEGQCKNLSCDHPNESGSSQRLFFSRRLLALSNTSEAITPRLVSVNSFTSCDDPYGQNRMWTPIKPSISKPCWLFGLIFFGKSAGSGVAGFRIRRYFGAGKIKGP